jgi:hypothetical protein
MLVNDVHLVNDQEARFDRVGGVVRLKALDQTLDARAGDSLYLSLESGKFLFVDWPRFVNGKLNHFRAFSSVSRRGQHPHDMIEGRPQMMDDLPGEHAETEGNCSASVIVHCLQEKLAVYIGEDRIFAGLKELPDLSIEITDVLIGPF